MAHVGKLELDFVGVVPVKHNSVKVLLRYLHFSNTINLSCFVFHYGFRTKKKRYGKFH
jgi:hypothetical protein